MWDKISPYVNTGKKLKIKGDKLIAILLQNRFQGTLFGHAAMGTDEIVFKDDQIYSSQSPSYYTFALQNALFSLASAAAETKATGRNGYEFLFEVVKGYPADMLQKMLEPYKTENITMKPEVAQFSFLREALEPYAGKQSFSVVSLFMEQIHTLYFLLLTEQAAVLKASAAEREYATEEEKRRAEEEKLQKDRATISMSEEWLDLDRYVKRAFKYESVFSLFSWKEGDDLGGAHKIYLGFVQKLHPDRIQNAPERLREKANELLAVINSVYPLLKDDELRAKMLALTKKYGNIRTKERYEELLQVDELIIRADALFKLGEAGKAYKIYVEMYGRTKVSWLLEKMIYAYYHNRRPEEDAAKGIRDGRRVTPEGKYMKLRDYIQRLRDFKSALPLEILYILAEVYEKEHNIVMLRKTLQEILVLYPGESKAIGWLKKVDDWYRNRQQQQKKEG
ncbi:MAG TPA: hypothetical protein PKH10_02315 [bacterium]|nr:hypothetical protein [bacterium]